MYVTFNLAFLRAAKGKLTQRDVALATGLSQKTLSALETGTSQGVEFNTIARLCEFFSCTPNDLFNLEEEIEEIPVSAEALKKADEIITRGLKEAMEAPKQTPEEIWREFDAVREKIRDQAEQASQKHGKVKKRA